MINIFLQMGKSGRGLQKGPDSQENKNIRFLSHKRDKNACPWLPEVNELLSFVTNLTR